MEALHKESIRVESWCFLSFLAQNRCIFA
jgi:hypothetical protein